jgi:hypothetical protein
MALITYFNRNGCYFFWVVLYDVSLLLLCLSEEEEQDNGEEECIYEYYKQ